MPLSGRLCTHRKRIHQARQGIQARLDRIQPCLFFRQVVVGLVVDFPDHFVHLLPRHPEGMFLDHQLVILDAVGAGRCVQGGLGVKGERFAGQGEFHFPAAVPVDAVIVDVGAGDEAVFTDEGVDILFEVVVLDDNDGEKDAWDQDDGDDGGDGVAPFSGDRRVQAGYRPESQVLHHHVGSKGDEYRVDDEQVHRAQEEMGAQAGDAIPGRAQGRHQRRGDSNARDGGSPLLAAGLQDARKAAEKGDQDVVDSGAGPGFQFRRVRQVERGKEEEQGRCHEGDQDHHEEVLRRHFQEVGVVGPKGQADADDRAHQRRNEHRSDDHRRRIHIQPHRGDDNGEREDPHIGSPEPDATFDPLRGVVSVDVIVNVRVIADGPPQVVLIPLHSAAS